MRFVVARHKEEPAETRAQQAQGILDQLQTVADIAGDDESGVAQSGARHLQKPAPVLGEIGVQVPVVVRLEGTNVEQGKALLADSGLAILAAEDLTDAARKAVAAV